MRRVVLILLLSLTAIALATWHMDDKLRQQQRLVPSSTAMRERFPRQLTLLREVERAYQREDYVTALAQLGSGESLFTQAHTPGQLALAYYLLKGKLHWALWEYVDAEQAWEHAREYARTPRQQLVLARLQRDSRQVLSDINRERNERDVYLASPGVGPSGVLHGRIALVYVFLVDKGGAGWSLRDRDRVLRTWQATQGWLQARIADYGQHATFVRRNFLVDRNPQILRLQLGDAKTHYSQLDSITRLLAAQLGYPDLLSFSEAIRDQEQADQVMLLIQLAQDGRSFATRCMHTCAPQGEFAVLLESARSKKWQALQYTQAHESLHLFGADDLYNIRKAKYFEARDIMNYPSRVLQASTLDALTAWSVGLTQQRPRTPFKIKTFH